MTQERFIQLIDKPELLANISYEELKTLAFAYPYAHNLRYLLALKAKQEDHPEKARIIQNAAAYSLDRRCLFMLMEAGQLAPQRIPLVSKEEVLELKPIETVQRELDALSPVPREEKPKKMSAEAELINALPPEVLEHAEEPPRLDWEPPVEETVEAASGMPEQTPPPDEPEAVPEQTDEPLSDAEAPAASPGPMPQPVSQPPILHQPFIQWMSQFHPPLLEGKKAVSPVQRVRAAEKDPAKGGIAQVLAEKSVAEDKDVISETLARLLVKQGHRDKAIVMYERLRLSFPEKSAYFAAEIEKLKK